MNGPALIATATTLPARCAEWRSVIVLGDDLPSRGCMEANVQTRHAALTTRWRTPHDR